jgi:hypothetical protein
MTVQEVLAAMALYEVARRPVIERAENRLAEKARAWGTRWQSPEYTDELVDERLRRAVDHLFMALDNERHGDVGHDEVVKRAADVVNQAIFAADPRRG